jgi:hypothetical protein
MTLWRGVFATIVLLLGSASAFAQVPVPVRFVEYSAKFLCGDAKTRLPQRYDPVFTKLRSIFITRNFRGAAARDFCRFR